jgi:ssDNA-binding Zn-finger/Zn-ribbon topoisomerase 1
MLFLYALTILAIVGAAGLFGTSIRAEESRAQRCPKCGRKRMVKKKKDPFSKSAGWECTSCGNDKDEFGNKL